jgi:uncharacterized membrane protein YfcA
MRGRCTTFYRHAMVQTQTRISWPLFAAVASVAIVAAVVPLTHSVDVVAVFSSALVSSIVGFAFSPLCGAFLFHTGEAPVRVVQILFVSSIAVQSVSLVALRQAVRWRTLAPFFAGGVFGLPLGLYVLYHADIATYVHAMGFFLISYGAYMFFRRTTRVRLTARGNCVADVCAGFLGGITGGAAGFPAAFVTIWCGLRGYDKVQQRAITQPFIFVMQIAALLATISIALLRDRSAGMDMTAFAYVPAAMSGAYLGLCVFRQLTDRQFQRVVNLFLIASGAGFIA